MIFSNSRYADGNVCQIFDNHSPDYTTFVTRNFYVPEVGRYYEYVFSDGDRLDKLAALLLQSPRNWYKILDVNPNIRDPFAIKPGTIVRIPYA
jgi:hypothetical protein